MMVLDSATAAIARARRASAADRQSAMMLDVEFRPLAAMHPLVEHWRELAAHALEPNIFYEPAFALAAAPVLGRNVVAGLVWSRGAAPQLVGFFPFRIERRRYGFPLSVLVGWTHPYAPLGTPLVHRDMAESVIAAWLDHVTQSHELPDLVLLQLLAEEGTFAAALTSVLARVNGEARSFDRHRRALLAPGTNHTGYRQALLQSKRQRRLRRQRRRLQELGAINVVQTKHGPELMRALDDFLILEAGGWKGRAGTAVLNDEGVTQFMRALVTGLAREGKVMIHRLLLNGKPIAATIALKSDHMAWGWKVAYDEAFAAYSPGMLLIGSLTESLLDDSAIARVDSCGAGGHVMMDQFWRERLAIADRLVTAAPGAEFSFGLVSRLEALRRAALAAAKSLRYQVRPR